MGHIAAVSDRSGGAETVPSAVPATEVLSAQVSAVPATAVLSPELSGAALVLRERQLQGLLESGYAQMERVNAATGATTAKFHVRAWQTAAGAVPGAAGAVPGGAGADADCLTTAVPRLPRRLRSLGTHAAPGEGRFAQHTRAATSLRSDVLGRLARNRCGGSRGARCASENGNWRCPGMATCPCGMCGRYFCINCVQTFEEDDGSLSHLCGRCVDAIMNDNQGRRDAVAAAGRHRPIRDVQPQVSEPAQAAWNLANVRHVTLKTLLGDRSGGGKHAMACDEEPNKKKMKEHDVINKALKHGLKTEGIDYEKFVEFHGLDDHGPKQSKDR